MNKFHRLTILAAIATLGSLSGCYVGVRDHGPYRYENGDRIDRDGNREAHWCDNHHDDQGCGR